MNFSHFLHFNQSCPVCGNFLTLYLHVLDGPLWKAAKVNSSTYHFSQIISIDRELEAHSYLRLTEKENELQIELSSPATIRKFKAWTFYFFVMCNPKAVEAGSEDFVGINPYDACYYRSSSFVELKEGEGKIWHLSLTNPEETVEGDIRDEVFTFKTIQKGKAEKIYILNFNNEEKKTFVGHYFVTEQEREDPQFDPKILTMELPMMKVRPNFDIAQRDKLISRLDNWTLMS